MFAIVRLLLPRRYRAFINRLAAGFMLGALVGIVLANVTQGPLGDAAFYWVPALMVVGVVVAWRTRRRTA